MKGQNHHSIANRDFRRALRKNATDAERHLWRCLRGSQLAGFRFRRQHPFEGYVLDFVCIEKRLIVEVDGSQHLDSEHDRVRDSRLRAAGFSVLRFWNNQVLMESDAVIETIWRALIEPGPSSSRPRPPSPPQPSP